MEALRGGGSPSYSNSRKQTARAHGLGDMREGGHLRLNNRARRLRIAIMPRGLFLVRPTITQALKDTPLGVVPIYGSHSCPFPSYVFPRDDRVSRPSRVGSEFYYRSKALVTYGWFGHQQHLAALFTTLMSSRNQLFQPFLGPMSTCDSLPKKNS